MTNSKLETAGEDSNDNDEKNFSNGNTFYIYGTFDSSIAKKVLPSLIAQVEMQGKIKNGLIKFFINSPGGETSYLYNLLALIEKAKKEGTTVETHVYGNAFSCGSMLACSGTKGHRFVSENATHLCHLGYGGFGASSDVELTRRSSILKDHFNRIRKLYKKYAKIKNLEEVIMHDSLYFSGKEIIQNGLADKIID